MNTISTTPPTNRTAMPARPWFGLLRGLLLACWPGLGLHTAADDDPTPAWQHAAHRRRLVLLATILLLGVGAALLGPSAGIPVGWPLLLLGFLFTWIGTGLVTALMGAWVLWRGDPHAVAAAGRAPIHQDARTAIVMAICNEDIATVYGGLRATCESLAATGMLRLFDIYLLSDTPNPVLRAAEVRAWRELRASLGDGPDAPGGRIFYRSRRHRTARKAGNVADFCRRWGRNYRYMVVLDADSVMAGDTLVALVRTMEQHPRAGILQTLPQPLGQDTLHARAQQFGVRVSGRLFALGMAYWQLGESHYWGHNAILRVQPFMEHCRMAPLPGQGGLSGHILSHDFVEAALMRRAGYEVWLLPFLGGSWEQTPPNLLDELQRDRRWCQGNLQNARLIAEPGWRPAHRAMFATGALSYLVAPLWLAMLASGAFVVARWPATDGTVLLLWSLTLVLLLLPRVLGVSAILVRGEQAGHGGTARLLASTVLEALVSALQAPVRMLAHSCFIAGALTGLRLEWKSPPRDAHNVRWGDAMARVGLLTLPALALAVALLPGAGRDGSWSLLPVLLPLALAVPMVVASSHAGLGALARRWGLLTVGEELVAPRPLRRARHAQAFAALQPPAPPRVQPPRSAAAATHWQGTWAAVAAGVLLFAVVPRMATSPVPTPLQRDAVELLAQSRVWQEPRPASTLLAQASPEPRTRGTSVRYLPSRYIDDAVRRRALRAVERALAQQGQLG